MELIPVLFVFFLLMSTGAHPLIVLILTVFVSAGAWGFVRGVRKYRKLRKPTYRGEWKQ